MDNKYLFTYILGEYQINYDNSISAKTFSGPTYYGITFTNGNSEWEIILSLIGYRLLINESNGSWKDLPFKEGTFSFLPPGVKVSKI